MSRVVSLIVLLLAGYVVGASGSTLLLAHAPGLGWIPAIVRATLLPITIGLACAGGGLLWWRAQGRPRGGWDTHGSARFSRADEDRASLKTDDGLIVGRGGFGHDSWLMRYAGPSHLLTIAPTRSGKGVGAIIPNLLLAERAVLCVDPKGENARVTARRRAELGPVWVLDPFAVSGQPSAAFNPLDGLDPTGVDLAEDAALIAEALVHDPPHQVGEAHWNEEAKALIAGIILHVVTSAPPSLRNLLTLRTHLTTSPDRFLALLDDMQASPAAGGLVARSANRHLGKGDREAAGVLSAAQRHTHFLDSPRMAAVLSGSDFRFEDLKRGPASVFLVLPPDRLGTHARWLRLLVVQALGALARTPASGPGGQAPAGPPVLFLLDEFAALGPLEPVARAFGLMAGYGVQLWAILQDLHQLKATYGQQAGTFLSNAGLIQVFNVAEVETAAWVSRSLGSSTEAYVTTGASRSQNPSGWLATHTASTTQHLARRDLMTPDEVMRLDGDQLLLLRPGSAPTLARKVRYYADLEFRGLFDA